VAEPVYRPVIGLARVLFAAEGLRFSVTGSEHVPRAGGAVMVINHISYLDFAYAGLAARPAGRMIRFMAKQEVFDHRISGPLMRGMRHIPVDRESGANSFRAAVAALRDGEIVGVFPEATISRSFELKEFKAGATRMASAAKVPLLPTVLWGSQRIWTKDHPKRLGRTKVAITISVGEPVEAPRGADAEAATTEVRHRMEALLHEAQRTYPDQPSGEDDRWWLPARLGGSAPTPEVAAKLDEEERLRRAERRERRDSP
jgi:1-acyl-sn-glycerol-3-phosphate acyltransferase